MRIVTHLLGIAIVVLLALVLLYLTRFWVFTDWWGNEGLWGFKDLSRHGDFLTRQLRGTPWQPFSLLLWLAGGFLALSLLQTVAARIGRLFSRH
jgi:hypothetical protein